MPISEVYNCDCLEYMRSLPDKHFDLSIADPPFGMNIHKSGRLKKYNQQWVGDQIPTKEVFDEIFRVSKHAIIWGGNYFGLPPNKHFIIWDKMQPFDFSMAMCEYAWSNIGKPAKIFRYMVQKEKNKIHPTQKPIALYAWLLDNYAKVGDKIFDPFLGSGSSRIAAFKKGFDFYACELDKGYYEAQEERFRRECLGEIKRSNGKIITQIRLFEL